MQLMEERQQHEVAIAEYKQVDYGAPGIIIFKIIIVAL